MNKIYIQVALIFYLLCMVLCTRFALCKFFFSFLLSFFLFSSLFFCLFSLFSLFLVRAPAPKNCRFWKGFVAGALIYVLHRRIAHFFTSCTATMPTLLRLALSYNTCCEKEGYPLLPSKMIFVPSLVLVVPPKNSHQPWPFRCLAAATNPSSTIQLHCTLSKHLFKRFREFRRLCSHQRRSYQGRHQSSKTQNRLPPRGNIDD